VLIGSGGEVLGRGCNAAETARDGARGGVHGKFVVHAEMAALRQALDRPEGAGGVCGSTVYIARLTPRGEHFEEAPPCATCEGVLRACGVRRAFFTTAAGRIETLETWGGEAPPEGMTPDQRKWVGLR